MNKEKLNWLYKPISIPNITEISQELQQVIEENPLIMEGLPGYDLIINSNDILKKSAPKFVQLLRDLNLYDRWEYSGWSTSDKAGAVAIVHTDYNWPDRSYALNIPVLNCHDSWTVWYETNPNSGVTTLRKYKDSILPEKWQDYYPGQQWRDEDVLGELDRMPATQAAFVNISVPHRPVNLHEEKRVLLSTRFLPELWDYNFNRLDFTIDR